jgi:hypothetical protein
MMKKIVRLTESDLTRIVKRVIKENKKQPVNEGIGTGLLVLTGVGVLYLGRKLKKFIDNYGKYFSTVQLSLFLSQIKKIEDGGVDAKIVVKEKGKYTYIGIVIDGSLFDALTIDMENDEIYSGNKKEPKLEDRILPRTLPYNANTENIEEIREAEEILVDEILGIIAKYGKSKNETNDKIDDERI